MLISYVTSVPSVLMFFKLKRTKKADANQYKPYSSIKSFALIFNSLLADVLNQLKFYIF